MTPVTYHTQVRSLYERRVLNVPDETDDQEADEESEEAADAPTLDTLFTAEANAARGVAAEPMPVADFEGSSEKDSTSAG